MQVLFTSDKSSITTLECSLHDTPFGEMLTAWHDEMLCFATFTTFLGREKAFNELNALFPKASFAITGRHLSIFNSKLKGILLAGTPFQQDVWRALLTVKSGTTITYSELAIRANHPTAIRAVATCVGRNPINIIVPCHRIVPATGGVGNYHPGADIKRMLLKWEGALP